mmetsp:Transcript_10376/g.17430  ORF Transcript_10376/g.17430 Transcript_10376/m.17430 type:complete len:80 (+) Transcript_10376:3-242(+)
MMKKTKEGKCKISGAILQKGYLESIGHGCSFNLQYSTTPDMPSDILDDDTPSVPPSSVSSRVMVSDASSLDGVDCNCFF